VIASYILAFGFVAALGFVAARGARLDDERAMNTASAQQLSRKVDKVATDLQAVRATVTQVAAKLEPARAEAVPAASASTAWQLFHEADLIAGDPERYAEAMSKLAQAQAADPYNTEVLNLLGRIQAERKEYGSARTFYDRVIALQPEHLGARQALATLYLNQKHCAEAAPHIARLRTRTDEGSAQRVRRYERECSSAETATLPDL
jgi:tetratricopeptide (TPR) repeat protein